MVFVCGLCVCEMCLVPLVAQSALTRNSDVCLEMIAQEGGLPPLVAFLSTTTLPQLPPSPPQSRIESTLVAAKKKNKHKNADGHHFIQLTVQRQTRQTPCSSFL